MGLLFKSSLYLAVCLVIGTAQPVDKPFIFEKNQKILLFRESKPFDLTCNTISDTSGVEFSWQKDGKPLDLTKEPSIKPIPNGIKFLNPTKDNEGQYQCFAKTKNGVASTRVIHVKRSYINKVEAKTVKLNPVEGKQFKLECSAPEGYPKPAIRWLRQKLDNTNSKDVKDRRVVQGPDGSLYFSNATKDDASKEHKYVCDAISPASDVPVKVVEYIVESVENNNEKPELVPQYLSQDMITEAGGPTYIYCVYGGTPLAHPDWFYEGKDVNGKPDDRITRHNRSSGRRLLIKDTYLSDQGTYTCKVNNGVGKPQEHSIHLTVVESPKYSKQPESIVSTTSGKDVTIPCQVKGLPAPKVTWTLNAVPLKESDRVSINTAGSGKDISVADLVIKNVQKTDVGYYGCRATNEHGDEYAESLLTVA